MMVSQRGGFPPQSSDKAGEFWIMRRAANHGYADPMHSLNIIWAPLRQALITASKAQA
jgi:hypothetical protein